MKKTFLFSVFSSVLIFIFFNVTSAGDQLAGTTGWRAGVARAVITPQEPIWMAGYGSRDHVS